jgi:excisionase family DNA binding protein
MLTQSGTQIHDLREVIAEVLKEELRHFMPQCIAAIKSNKSETPIERDSLLSRAQAARVLSVSIQTVAKLIRLKQLPSVKVQRRTMIRQSDLTLLVTARDKQDRRAS